MVAQELLPIYPGLVTETPVYDKEGKPTGETELGINYSVFNPILIKTTQEMYSLFMGEINALKTEVAALSAR